MRADRDLVDVAQAGKALGVSVSTVWRLIRRGTLPSVRRGARRLVPARALASIPNRRKGRALPAFDGDHPIFRLAGAGRSGGAPPGARDKHAVLDR